MNHVSDNIGLRLWIPAQNVYDETIIDQWDLCTYILFKTRSGWYNLPIVDGAIPEEYATIK